MYFYYTSLFPTPLERYFYENKIHYPFVWHGTANYRGHVATWEIAHNQMYLNKVETDNHKEMGIKELFPEMSPTEGRIKATWFTGILMLGVGEAVTR